jgi:hypothetical protein
LKITINQSFFPTWKSVSSVHEITLQVLWKN